VCGIDLETGVFNPTKASKPKSEKNELKCDL